MDRGRIGVGSAACVSCPAVATPDAEAPALADAVPVAPVVADVPVAPLLLAGPVGFAWVPAGTAGLSGFPGFAPLIPTRCAICASIGVTWPAGGKAGCETNFVKFFIGRFLSLFASSEILSLSKLKTGFLSWAEARPASASAESARKKHTRFFLSLIASLYKRMVMRDFSSEADSTKRWDASTYVVIA